jgi:hypothetical protein
MTKPNAEPEIRNVFTLFASKGRKDEVIAGVSYQGDLRGHQPDDVVIDTQSGTMNLLMTNGSEMMLCKLTQQNSALINKYYDEHKKGINGHNPDQPIKVDLIRVDENHKPIKPCYRVTAVVI